MSFARLLASLIFFVVFPIVSSAENYLEYYQRIAKAEEALVSAQYPQALKQYQETFSSYSYNNPIDCYVSAQVASFLGDSAACAGLLASGLRFGLPLQTIGANPHLSRYIGRTGGPYSLSQATLDSCGRIYRQSIKQEARTTIISLIQRDQAVVQQPGSIYQADGRSLKPEYRALWDSLLQEVILLTRQYGFPAQRVAGTMNGEDGLFKTGPNSVFAYYILIHHGNAWPQLGAMLWEELQKGNITPQMYAAIQDYSSGSTAGEILGYLSLRPCERSACRAYLRKHQQDIDIDRQKIGLCSYAVMQRKDAATRAYRKWIAAVAKPGAAYFDFQPELHFMGVSGG